MRQTLYMFNLPGANGMTVTLTPTLFMILALTYSELNGYNPKAHLVIGMTRLRGCCFHEVRGRSFEGFEIIE